MSVKINISNRMLAIVIIPYGGREPRKSGQKIQVAALV